MTALRVIGDIGGTYARFAVAERGKYSELQHLSVSKYPSLKDAFGEWRRERVRYRSRGGAQRQLGCESDPHMGGEAQLLHS
jgi:glucokinase